MDRHPEIDRASHPLIYRLYRRFCAGIYGWAAPIYDFVADLVSLGQWMSWLKMARDEVEGGRVLELGFGTGRLQSLLSENEETSVHGLELSEEMHRQCSKRMTRIGRDSKRVRADGTYLPYKDESFDFIVATFPEEYIVSRETLAEIARTLNADGKALFMGRWISLRSRWLSYFFPVFYRSPTEEEREDLISHAKDCGLYATIEDRELRGVTHHLVHLRKIKEEGLVEG